jgi:hypothetical protein
MTKVKKHNRKNSSGKVSGVKKHLRNVGKSKVKTHNKNLNVKDEINGVFIDSTVDNKTNQQEQITKQDIKDFDEGGKYDNIYKEWLAKFDYPNDDKSWNHFQDQLNIKGFTNNFISKRVTETEKYDGFDPEYIKKIKNQIGRMPTKKELDIFKKWRKNEIDRNQPKENVNTQKGFEKLNFYNNIELPNKEFDFWHNNHVKFLDEDYMGQVPAKFAYSMGAVKKGLPCKYYKTQTNAILRIFDDGLGWDYCGGLSYDDLMDSINKKEKEKNLDTLGRLSDKNYAQYISNVTGVKSEIDPLDKHTLMLHIDSFKKLGDRKAPRKLGDRKAPRKKQAEMFIKLLKNSRTDIKKVNYVDYRKDSGRSYIVEENI